MGRIGAVLAQSRPSPVQLSTVGQPSSRIGSVLVSLARRVGQATLEAPQTIHRAVQSELVRGGRAASQIPTFQWYAEPLGDIVRRPLELARLPTAATAGFAPGTKIGAVLRGLEAQAQDVTAAGFGDVLAQELGVGALGTGIGLGSRVRQALRNRLAPEVIPAGQPIPPTQRVVARPLQPAPEGSSLIREPEAQLRLPYEPTEPTRPTGLRPVPLLPATTLAQTHPGLTLRPPISAGRLINTPAPGAPVVPITRQEADRLFGQSVELRPGLLAPKVFRVVPPEASATATGLQYWYKYDLPASSGLRYPARSIPTPSEALEVREPSRPVAGSQLVERAINKFGKTDVPESVAFITPDGRQIDSSGKRLGSSSEGRNIDHRQIAVSALPASAKTKGISGDDALKLFMKDTGAIRTNITGNELNAHFVQQPTQQQIQAIAKLARGRTIVADISDVTTGTTLSSIQTDSIGQLQRFLGKNFVRSVPQTGRISQPLVRQQAIQAVAKELREQSVILNQQRLSLRKRVIEAGGIKPTLAGGLREELQAIRPFLRQGGQAIDDLATELGFENGEALRTALVAGQGARLPKLAELQRQATQVVDSEP